MTRIIPKRWDRIKEAFRSIDKAIVDRGDIHDQTKIQQLEEKMNQIDGFSDFNKINLSHISQSANKKTQLKNSKRY